VCQLTSVASLITPVGGRFQEPQQLWLLHQLFRLLTGTAVRVNTRILMYFFKQKCVHYKCQILCITACLLHAGQLVSADYSSPQQKTLLLSRTINGSYCRVSFYYYATSGIVLSVNTPDALGELWVSSESAVSAEQWNEVSIHITYNISDPRVNFALSFRVDGVGLVAIDDISLHPCIDCQTG